MQPISRRTLIAMLAAAPVPLSGCGASGQRARLETFDRVRNLVEEHYFNAAALEGEWRSERGRYRALAGRSETATALYLDCLIPMLEGLDSSHLVLTPPMTLTLSASRSFRLPTVRRGGALVMLSAHDEAGMGATLTSDGERLIVDAVDASGPAFAQGLRSGDQVRLVYLKPGADGGHLRLVTLSTNAEIEVEWTRRTPPGPRAVTLVAKNTACVRFNTFDRETVDWVLTTLSGGPGQVILDLRSNRGGLLLELWRLLSALLPPGSDIGTFASRTNDRPTLTGEVARLPVERLAVLTGLRTASAGEVLAAVLADHGRAVTVGDRTAGSVLAAQLYRLADGGQLSVPFSDYRSPSGERLEGSGVVPAVSRYDPVPSDAFLAMAQRITAS